MRLKLVPENTNWDFFKYRTLTFGASIVMMIASLALWLTVGLNFGIDFRGGTTIRTQSEQPVDVGAYRDAIAPLGLGDTSISEVFDPSFDDDHHVAMIRIQAQDGQESISAETVTQVEQALKALDETVHFTQVESVGPKVSGELIQTAVLAVAAALAAILFYIWLRFEWQFSVGVVPDVISVRLRVSFTDRFITSISGLVLNLRRFSRSRSKITTVSLIE